MSKVSVSCLIVAASLAVAGCNPDSGSSSADSSDKGGVTGTSFTDLVDANLLNERAIEIIPPTGGSAVTISPESDPTEHTALELDQTYFGEFQHRDEFKLELNPGRYTLRFRGMN